MDFVVVHFPGFFSYFHIFSYLFPIHCWVLFDACRKKKRRKISHNSQSLHNIAPFRSSRRGFYEAGSAVEKKRQNKWRNEKITKWTVFFVGTSAKMAREKQLAAAAIKTIHGQEQQSLTATIHSRSWAPEHCETTRCSGNSTPYSHTASAHTQRRRAKRSKRCKTEKLAGNEFISVQNRIGCASFRYVPMRYRPICATGAASSTYIRIVNNASDAT